MCAQLHVETMGRVTADRILDSTHCCLLQCMLLYTDHLHVGDASRKSDMDKDGVVKKQSHSMTISEQQMISQFPVHHQAPVGADTSKYR